MKQLLIFISLFLAIVCNINAQSIAANQFNGRLQMTAVSNVSDSIWSITGYFTNSVNKYTTTQIAVNDKFFCQIGANTYVGRISVINSASDVTKLITFRVICNYPNPPNNIGAIVRATSNGYPVFVDGLPNALQAGIQNYFATLINTNAAGSPCEQTITQAAHGFRDFTPVRWNSNTSTYERSTNDTIVPDYIVVDSLTANTFKVANCGTYTTALANGLYWFTSASPGYSLTQDTTKVPLFQALNGKMILNPIVGFNLMSGDGSGTGITDGDKGEITVTDDGATWTIDNGVISNAKLATNAVDSTKAANLSPNDLAQTGASSGQVLTWTGSKYAPRDASNSSAKDTIYILGSGQSNMIGRPDTSSSSGVLWDSLRNSQVFVHTSSGWAIANYANVHGGTTYAVPVNNAVWQFCKQLQRRTKRPVKFVISATGGQALSYWTGNTYPASGTGWTNLTIAVSNSGVTTFDGFIWCQGESDLANTEYETEFYDYFLSTLREQSWFDAYTPVVITGMPSNNEDYVDLDDRFNQLGNNDDAYLTIARTKRLTLVQDDPQSPGVPVHYDGIALDKLGARYYNAYINNPKNLDTVYTQATGSDDGLPSGLINYYKAESQGLSNGATASTFTDQIGGVTLTTASGALTYNTSQIYTEGAFSNSSNLATRASLSNGNITIAMSVRWDAAPTGIGLLFSAQASGGSASRIYIGANNSDWYFRAGGATDSGDMVSQSFSTSTDYILTLTISGSTATCYVDGTNVGTGTISNTATMNFVSAFGYWDGTSLLLADAKIARLAIWNRALDSSEVTDVVNIFNN